MYSATSQGTVQFGHDFGLIRSMVHTSALCSNIFDVHGYIVSNGLWQLLSFQQVTYMYIN